MLSHYGPLIGSALVLIATGTAIAITAKAGRGIEQFRQEDHELFEGKRPGNGK